MRPFFYAFIVLFILQGCGYKPTSRSAKSILGTKVSVSVDVYSADPLNSVIIKDAVLQALITRFRIVTTPKEFSITHLDVKLKRVIETAIEYDLNGYVIAKRITVALAVNRVTKGVKKSYNVSGLFDFSIEPNATVSDTDRFKSIRRASLKAIDALIVQLALEGSM